MHHDHDDLDDLSGLGYGRRARRGRRRVPGWTRSAEAWAGGPPPGPTFEVPLPGPPFGDRVFFWGPGGRRRGRGRARRGDIRAAILLVLADRPMHGYEVMTELAERSGGVWRPSPGSVYPTLQQLEDEDLVRSEVLDQKRIFRLTDAGREESERVAARGAPWATVSDGLNDEQRALHHAAAQLTAAVMQVAHAGSDEQVRAAQVLLDGARKSVYRLLAEDDEHEQADG
ncbi:MAG TPA: PadR family transcriptional regulator [Acidimicrobiia bacterium]|jgi:DNA-binding PadR family transcriptional regulator